MLRAEILPPTKAPSALTRQRSDSARTTLTKRTWTMMTQVQCRGYAPVALGLSDPPSLTHSVTIFTQRHAELVYRIPVQKRTSLTSVRALPSTNFIIRIIAIRVSLSLLINSPLFSLYFTFYLISLISIYFLLVTNKQVSYCILSVANLSCFPYFIMSHSL